jgi:hypothetical protein
MVYKKYIKKDGKLYGPYIYHSRRVGDKVISEYRGAKKDFKYKKLMIFCACILILGMLVSFFILFKPRLSGQAILGLQGNYENKVLHGDLKFSLSQGEFIPADSKIIFETDSESYEYALKDFVDEAPIEGKFYVNGKGLDASGLGYGIIGEKLSYPEVGFTFKIIPSDGEPKENVNEEPKENPSEEPIIDLNATEEPLSNETLADSIEENETTSESQENETITNLEDNETSPEETPDTNEPLQEEIQQTENAEEQTILQNEEVTGESEESQAPITGGIIGKLFRVVSNFFLSLNPTGKAVAEGGVIEGKTSKLNPFSYKLNAGQSIEIVSSEHAVHVDNLDGQAVVTTDYSEIENGFGEEYEGNETKQFEISIEGLNLSFKEEEIKVSLKHEGEELISLTAPLSEDINVQSENASFEAEIFSDALSEEEKEILFNEFGNSSVKSEVNSYKDKIRVRYEIGEMWIENYYNSNLENETLKSQMEQDRINWLKDLAISLGNDKSNATEIEGFASEYKIS